MKSVLAMVVLTCLLSGCQGETQAVALEARTVPIDEQISADASRLTDTHVRTEIKNNAGISLFTVDYRVVDNKIRAEYSLFPVAAEDVPAQAPLTGVLEYDGDDVPALDDAVTGAVVIYTNLQRAALGQYDNWGCDLLPGRFNWVASCGPKGVCCDIHDACYARVRCKASSWKAPPWNKCQILCNGPAVACFTSALPVGPSVCCVRGNCGKPR
jgi:hypothetical protein